MQRSLPPIRRVTLFIAFSLGLALAGCGKDLTDAEYVAKAKESRDRADFRASVIELKSALQKNPNNAEARRLLGEINVTLGNGANAEKELRAALALGVAREAILFSLAEALQLQNKHQQILDEVDIPLSLDAADRAKLGAYRGDAWLALKKPQQAQREYEEALAVDSGAALAKLGLARLAVARDETDRAFQLVREALESSPQEAKAWSFQAELYKTKGDLEKAEASYSKAIASRRLNQIDRAERALVRIDLKKLDAAREDIQALKTQAPNLFLTPYAEGALATAQKNYPAAQSAFEQSLKLNDQYPPLLYFLSVAHLMQNHLPQAEDTIRRFLLVSSGSPKGQQMLAFIKFKRNDFDGARKSLAPLVERFPEDVFAQRLMGEIELALGDDAKGLEYLQKAVGLAPDSPDLHTQLALGLLFSGKEQRGREELKTAIKLQPGSAQAAVILALTQMRANEFDKAAETITAIKAKMPDNAGPHNLEGLLYLGRGDEKRAETAFREALQRAPGNPLAADNLAEMALKQKRFDEARALYDGVLKANPKHLETQLKLARLDDLQGRRADMVAKLTQAVQDHPNALQPRLLLARYYLQLDQAQRGQTLLEEIRPNYPENPALLAILTETQLASNQPERALETAKRLQEAAPRSASAAFMLAEAYAENRDAKNLRAALQRSLEIDPRFLRSRIALVKLSVDEHKPAEAEKQLLALLKDNPQDLDVIALKGWFALQQKRPQDAIGAYQEVLTRLPSGANVANLAQAQWLAGEKDKALDTLANWNQRNPKDAYVHYVRSNLYRQLGKHQEAREQLEKVLAINPDNGLALNDMAWLLRRENPVQAQTYAEKAVNSAPKVAPFIDTLALVLIEKTEFERALRLMQHAYALDPDNPSIRYHLAVAQEKNGAAEDAARTLRELLSAPQPFHERDEAEKLLARLTQ